MKLGGHLEGTEQQFAPEFGPNRPVRLDGRADLLFSTFKPNQKVQLLLLTVGFSLITLVLLGRYRGNFAAR